MDSEKELTFYLDLLKDDGSKYTIEIEPINTNIGRAWTQLLRDAIDNGAMLTEPERIYSLNDKWSTKAIKKKLIECVNTVNSYKEGTIEYKNNWNYLHRYFEDFMQPDNIFYLSAPEHVQFAIREFNILIHRLEHQERNNNEKIVVTLNKRPRRLMTPEEASEFSLDLEDGDVVIKYCHKGKKVLDIFSDDELDNRHVSDTNIKPHKKISADFKIYLTQPISQNRKDEFHTWINENESFFNDLGIDFRDPLNTIGFGKCARIVGDIDKIKKEMYGVTKIDNVRYN